MEQHTHFSKLKLLSFFVLIFSILTTTTYAQELVPFQQVYPILANDEPPVVRGDMVVIGNSILGIEDDAFGETPRRAGLSFTANEEYNGRLSNNGAERGYIDIDSDNRFISVFSPGLPNSETEYSDPFNTFGSPLNSPTSATTGTFSSSAAELDITSGVGDGGQVCSTIVKALLYWGGIYPVESQIEGESSANEVTLERPDCQGCEHYTDIKILPPGATEYVDIRASNSGDDYSLANPNTSLQSRVIFDGASNSDPLRVHAIRAEETKDVPYACVADVTSLFTHLQNFDQDVLGNWTVANVRAITGFRGNGSGGGWSLAVVYEDPLADTQKNITFFEGFVNISTGDAPQQFNITGFETIPAGPVNVDIATIGLEGDVGIPGDRFQINDANDDGTISPLEDDWIALAPDGENANNFYDSSIFSITPEDRRTPQVPVTLPLERFPNSSNTLGYDSDHFRIDNGQSGNEYITNSDNSADFRVFTSGDSYSNFFNAFAIDVIAPELEVVKRAFRQDSSEFSETDEVDLGDVIVYETTITNRGNDEAVNVSFVDILPINTNFENIDVFRGGNLIPESEITNIATTATDNETGLTFDTRQISFNLLAPGVTSLGLGETVVITFSVNVVDDCELLEDICTNQIQNQVDVSYFGLIDIENNVNNPFEYEVQSAFDVDDCENPDFGPTVLLSDQSFCQDFVRTRELCAEDLILEGGEGFNEYQWFFENRRITTNSDGTPINSTDNSIRVDATGTYRVEQLKGTSPQFASCRDVRVNFEVVLFDPLAQLNNPFTDLGEPIEPVCSVDNTPIIGIQLCNDPIEIPTNFPDGTTFSWQRLDESLDCAQNVQNCPFSSVSGADCYAEVSTESSFTLSQQGSYLLTVILNPGGCPFDYYFDAVPIDLNQVLRASPPSCDDEVVFTVEGVDLSAGNAVDFELNFEVTNDGNTLTFPAEELTPGSGIFDTYRLPRVPGEGYSVVGVITTNIEGSCTFRTSAETVNFIDLTVTPEIVRQASCFEDNDTTDNFDPTTGDIRVTIEDNNPSGPAAAAAATPYIINLINAGTGDLVESSGSINTNTFLFENVNPENRYEVEAFAFGNTTSANCVFPANVEALEVPLPFSFNNNIISDLSCNPAQIEIDLTIPAGTNEEDYTFTIREIPGNVFTGDQIIFVDDINNRPPDVIDDGSSDIDEVDENIINYIDFSVITDGVLTIVVSSPEAGCALEEQVTINPFVLPAIMVEDFDNVTCEGDQDGSITVSSTEAGVNPTYELILDGDVIKTQTTPIFTGLEEGEYTIRVIRVIDSQNTCPAETTQSIGPAVEFTAPVINAPEYFCGSDGVAIEINTSAIGGTGSLTYNLLRNGSIFRTYFNETDIALESFPEGTYQLSVTDEDLCPVISNEIVIQNLEITLSSNPVSPIPASCNVTTTSGDPAAEVTISALFNVTGVETVANYTINISDEASLIGTSAADGVFTLPAGIHIIEASTTNFACTETIEIVIDPIDPIEVSAEDDFVCSDEEGQLTFNISNFTSDYQYTLVSDTGSITPITSTSTDNPLVITAPSLLADDYTITVIDNQTRCEAVANVSIIEQLVTLDPVDDIDLTCFGEPATIIVNPAGGEDPLNYEYSFGEDASFPNPSVFQDSNEITVFPTGLSEIYRYQVRNRITGCIETNTLTITQPEEVDLVNENPQDVVCDGDSAAGGGTPQDGSYDFVLSGGIVGETYTYTLFEFEDFTFTTPLGSTTSVKVDNNTNMTGLFSPLDPGSYRIRIQDSSLTCEYPDDLLTFDILPAPNEGEFTSSFTLANCEDGVTLFFEIQEGTGSPNGEAYTISQDRSATLAESVDPSIGGDNIFQFGDMDFPAGYTLGTFNQFNEDNNRIFAITNLDFDVVDDIAIIFDNLTLCRYSAVYDTDESPTFNITATPIPAGVCDISGSGLVDLEINYIFPSLPNTTVNIEIFRVGGDGTVLATLPNIPVVSGTSTIEQISGLPVGNLRARVQDQSVNGCNGTADFLIEIADPLSIPIFTEVLEDCDDRAMLINLTGNGGTPPYTFALSAAGTTDSTGLTFEETTTLDPSTFTNGAGDIEAVLWIKDLNGCDSSAPVQMDDYVTFVPDITNLDPLNDCIAGSDGSRITITDTSTWEGRPPYFYNVVGQGNDFIEITSVPFDIDILDPDGGVYDILFRDSIDCPAMLNITVPSTDFEVDVPGDSALDCTSNGVVTVEITSGGIATDTYSFVISQFTDTNGVITNPNTASDNPTIAGEFTADFTIPPTDPGIYEFTVTNTRTQCEFTTSTNVGEPEQVGIIAADDRLTCNSVPDGNVVFEITNYTGDINYTITDDATPTPATIAAGTITNYVGDFSTTGFVVTTGANTPTINATTGEITVPDFGAGNYTVTLTAGVCDTTADVLITQPDELIVDPITIVTPLSCVTDSAVISVTANGGNGDFTYELFRDTVSVATNDTGVFDQEVTDSDNDPTTPPNSYTVGVTDEEGCPQVISAPILISKPFEPVISVVVSDPIDCNGGSGSFTVSIDNTTTNPITADLTSIRYAVFVFDGTAPENKGAQVVAPQMETIINNISSGDYIVEAMDGLGCVGTFRIPMPGVSPVQFNDPVLDEEVSCLPTTAQYTLSAIGGRPVGGEYIFQQYTNFISEQGVPMGAPFTGSAYTITGNGQLFFRVIDNSTNSCDDFISFNAPPAPEQVSFDIDTTDSPLCFGDSGGFVDIEGSISGGIGDFTFNLYSGTDPMTGILLSETTTPAVIRLGESSFNNLLAGTYTYEVVSGTGEDACSSFKEFTIDQNPELLADAPIITGIGCPGEDDAIVRLKVEAATTLTGGVGPFVYTLAKNDVLVGLPIEVATDTEEAVFEFLSPCEDGTDCYTYSIVDNGTGCAGPSGTFTIEEKEPLLVELDEANSVAPICKGDLNGTRVYNVSGATAPYYYVLLEDPDAVEPTSEEIIAGGTQVPVATNQINLPGLAEDIAYRLFVIDSGNEQLGAELRICDPFFFEFEFETEDLDLFDVVTSPNCDDLNYTVGVINLTDLEDDDLSIRLHQRNPDGTDGIQITQVMVSTLALDDIPAGNYNVYIESVNGCTTTAPFRQILNLEEFERVMFVDTVTGGGSIQPFVGTNEINVFQLLVTGGVNPNGINPYRFEGTFASLDGGISAEIIDIDNDGKFTIVDTGLYTFRVFDNFGEDGVDCFDEASDIGINLIDIDIPNVFNPSSGASITNTWFPESLTSDFTNGITPIIGDGEPQVPGIVTTTNSTVTGGTTTGGTTTGGITTGGSVTGGSTPTTVPSTTDGFGNIITLVTSGDFVIQTITNTSGTTSVTIFENADVTPGGELITNGDTTTQTAISETTDGGDTIYTITTDGTTTGGTTEGGTTTGGTTTFVNTSTFEGEPGSFVTTEGTTEDATTTGGTTTGGTTTVITVPNGGGTAIVETFTGTTVTGGTTTDGTTTDGITTGGNVTGGISSDPQPIEFLDYENMEVFVFDRYGRLLDQFKGIRSKDGSGAAEEGWDGTYQGKEMPSGDYWYLIQLNDRDGREFTGHFTLYRRF